MRAWYVNTLKRRHNGHQCANGTFISISLDGHTVFWFKCHWSLFPKVWYIISNVVPCFLLPFSHIFFMLTSWYGNISRITGPAWRNPPAISGFFSQKISNAELDIFFAVSHIELLNKNCWWFLTPPRSCDVTIMEFNEHWYVLTHSGLVINMWVSELVYHWVLGGWLILNH